MRRSIKDILKKYHFHFLIVFPFIIIYTLSKNFKDVSLEMVYRPLFISVLFSLIFYFIFKLIYQNSKKSALFSTFVFIICSTYGTRYDFLEALYYQGLWPFNHIHRILLISDVIIILSLFIWILKNKKTNENLSAFLNVFFILIFSYNLFLFIYNKSLIKTTQNIKLNNIKKNNLNTPNIYYFILDGYANKITLKKHYKYSNSKFLNSLKKIGFYVCDTTYSNFYGTELSLKSTLNMDYFTKNNIKNNQVFNILKNFGYKINIIKSGYTVTANFENADIIHQPVGLNELERNLLDHTILRIDDVIGSTVYYRLKNQLNSIDKFITKERNQFIFTHIVAPHPPFVFDKNGKKIMSISKNVNNWEPKEKYLNQLIYISKEILKKVKKIIKIDPKAVIILQSDHGPYITSTNKFELFESRALTFNAIYADVKVYENYSKMKTNVNTFPILLNHYFNLNNKLLKDSLVGKYDFMNSITFKKRLYKK